LNGFEQLVINAYAALLSLDGFEQPAAMLSWGIALT
jgi:hypothetical protein